MIILTGDVKKPKELKYYVNINKYFYEAETPLRALDLCFKAFFALSAEYPKECDQCWIFIERYFFNMNREKPLPYISLGMLKSDLDLLN